MADGTLDTFVTFQSGQPIPIVMANARLADGNQRPNVLCSQLRSGLSYTQAAITQESYLNAADGGSDPSGCFADPGDQVAGNAPRHFSNLRGDGIRNLDASLSKEFTIKESMKLQIRAEMFNATNTPRFAFPDIGFGNESFGQVTSTTGNFPKDPQVGARFRSNSWAEDGYSPSSAIYSAFCPVLEDLLRRRRLLQAIAYPPCTAASIERPIDLTNLGTHVDLVVATSLGHEVIRMSHFTSLAKATPRSRNIVSRIENTRDGINDHEPKTIGGWHSTVSIGCCLVAVWNTG